MIYLKKLLIVIFPEKNSKIIKLKNISGNVHAYIVNINDENTEYMVALSVLEDENRFKVVKD